MTEEMEQVEVKVRYPSRIAIFCIVIFLGQFCSGRKGAMRLTQLTGPLLRLTVEPFPQFAICTTLSENNFC